MTDTPRNTPHTRALINQLRAYKWSWKRIGAHIGVAHQTARRWVDPEFRANQNRSKAACRPKIGGYYHLGLDIKDKVDRTEAERKLREIPPDTRTPAQRLMGDPIPQRSALYQRRERV